MRLSLSCHPQLSVIAPLVRGEFVKFDSSGIDAPGWLGIAFDEGARYIMTLGFFGQEPMIAAHSFFTS
jgi:hypothetical protein